MSKVLQLPVVPFAGAKPAGEHSKNPLGWHTGIRCPRCQMREVIYNGNYFCAGYGDLWKQPFDAPVECSWALPFNKDDTGPEPHHMDLERALIASQVSRNNSEKGKQA